MRGPGDRRRRPLRPPRVKGWGADGEAAGLGRAVGADRAVDPEGAAALSLSGSEATRRPQGVERDLVRAADGDPLGVPAARDGLWLGDDLLAAAARVAGGRRLAAVARAVARETARSGADRLVAAVIDSSHVRAFGGRKDRPEPGRSLKERLKAPPDRLRPRHAARR